MTAYRHTQIGWAIWLVLGASGALVSALAPWTVAAGVAGVLLGVGVLFGALTVRIEAGAMHVALGIGWIARRIPLADLRGYESATLPTLTGWGIRWTPRGWVWTVSGFRAVALALNNGRTFFVGTDEPEALAEALRAAAPELPAQIPDARADVQMGPGLALLAGLPFALAGGLVWASTWPVQVHAAQGLSVTSPLFHAEAAADEFVQVALVQQLPAIRSRTWGAAVGTQLRGHFVLDDGRPAQLFVNTDTPLFVRVDTADRVIVVQDATPEDTRALFATLRAQLPQASSASAP